MLKVCSYNNAGEAPSFIQDTERLSIKTMLIDKDFFLGACFTCAALALEVGTSKNFAPLPFVSSLQRCSGCQLVSYCSRNCQKVDWSQHKILCKEFPVENGKNVMVRETASAGNDTNKYLNAVMKLNAELSSMLLTVNLVGRRVNPVDGQEEPVYGMREHNDFFMKVRVCKICHEARPEKLMDCRCCAVSYCSRVHRLQDASHPSQECDILYGCAMTNWYLTQHHRLQIPDGLLNEACLKDGLKFEKVTKLAKYSSEKWLETIVNLINERLTLPLTIHFGLKNLKLGEQRKALSEISSLSIHIIYMTPILDPRIWEFFLHQLPNLKKLNLTFINGIMKLYNKYNTYLPVERCSECKRKKRIINYNIHPMHYHEYFSSRDYVQPDVVAVFGSTGELVHNLRNTDKSNIRTSLRNMTYSKHTVVILTDFLEGSLETCVKRFEDARPVKVLLDVQENPVRGFSTLRNSYFNINVNNFVCSIQGKH